MHLRRWLVYTSPGKQTHLTHSHTLLTGRIWISAQQVTFLPFYRMHPTSQTNLMKTRLWLAWIRLEIHWKSQAQTQTRKRVAKRVHCFALAWELVIARKSFRVQPFWTDSSIGLRWIQKYKYLSGLASSVKNPGAHRFVQSNHVEVSALSLYKWVNIEQHSSNRMENKKFYVICSGLIEMPSLDGFSRRTRDSIYIFSLFPVSLLYN